MLRILDTIGVINLSSFFDDHSANFSTLFHHRKGATDDYIEVLNFNDNHSNDRLDTLRVLFLGDSWMDNTPIPVGVGNFVSEKINSDIYLQFINGGTTSFSPSLILLQGEILISKYMPDLVIINIDETDLMDESLRYRTTSSRDAHGSLRAVTPDIVELAWNYGFLTLYKQPFYFLRLIEKVYFTRIFIPRLKELYYGRQEVASYESLMAPQLSSDVRISYKKQIEYFQNRVREMLARLTNLFPKRQRVLLTHHPHFLHLENEKQTAKYNNVVSEILSEQSTKFDVPYYDAISDIEVMYGNNYETFFEWPEDPFSHLTADGYERYGYFIGKKFLPQIQAVVEVKTKNQPK
jgi:hypothetical protein